MPTRARVRGPFSVEDHVATTGRAPAHGSRGAAAWPASTGRVARDPIIRIDIAGPRWYL